MEVNIMLAQRERLWSYVYRGRTILRTNIMLCVGDEYGGKLVQAVDYRYRIVYLIDM